MTEGKALGTIRTLTNFQRSCEGALSQALFASGRQLEARSLDGERETYIQARISDSDITVFIYEDEAQFRRDSGKNPKIYERPDFRSPQALEDAFVRDILRAVGGQRRFAESSGANPMSVVDAHQKRRRKIFEVLSFAMGLSAVIAILALVAMIAEIPAYWVVAVSDASKLVFGIASLVFVLLLMARAWFEE